MFRNIAKPTKEYLKIKLKDIYMPDNESIKIVVSIGQIVYQNKQLNNNINEVDTSQLTPDIYLFEYQEKTFLRSNSCYAAYSKIISKLSVRSLLRSSGRRRGLRGEVL